jgi:hypothetical protein
MSTLQVDLLTGKTQSSEGSTAAGQERSEFTIENAAAVKESAQDQIEDLREIYPAPSDNLLKAVTLLSEAIFACNDAIQAEEVADKFRADDCMLKVQAASMQLFELRGIGDGFGVVATALLFTFVNKQGIPFIKSEMHAILRTLKALRSAPFSTLEKGVAVTEILELEGLVIDPVPLTDLLNEAQEAGFVDS